MKSSYQFTNTPKPELASMHQTGEWRGSSLGRTVRDNNTYNTGANKHHGGSMSTTASQAVLFQPKSGSPSSGANKDYLKNILLQKFSKKYLGANSSDFQAAQFINSEVLNFIKNEKANSENLKLLQERI